MARYPPVVDRFVQQAINQVLSPIYENQFSEISYGFRPRRSCHEALRGAQSIINDGCIYVFDLDLERFFDRVNHSKLIEILSGAIKDGRVVSLIHKYLGYSFYVMKGNCQLTVHPKSKADMKQKLEEYIRGCIGYYHLKAYEWGNT